MVRLLVLDMLRRVAYWQLALLAFGFALAWALFPTRGSFGVAPVIAMSLAATYIIGPVAMLGWLGTPVVPYLPVSRRDVWRAAWIMGTLAPVTLLTALKLPGAIAGGPGWSSLMLSSLMDFLYAGAGCALLAAATSATGARGRGAFFLWAMVGLFGGIFWPFIVQWWLPTHWADISPSHGLLFAVGAALTAWSGLQSPALRWPQKKPLALTPSGPTTLPARSSGPTGLPRLLAHELVWSAGMAITLVITFLVVALIGSSMTGRFTTVEHFAASQHLFVFNPASFASADEDFGIFGQLGWYAFFIATVSARFPEALRQLRTLPLGTASLYSLLLGWPVLVWTGAWLLLLVIHTLFSQPVVTVRFPLWLTLVGLSQLSQALRLRVSARWAPAAFVGVGAMLPFAQLIGTAGWPLLAVWAIATAGAVALTISALSRNDTYKRTNPLAARMQGTL